MDTIARSRLPNLVAETKTTLVYTTLSEKDDHWNILILEYCSILPIKVKLYTKKKYLALRTFHDLMGLFSFIPFIPLVPFGPGPASRIPRGARCRGTAGADGKPVAHRNRRRDVRDVSGVSGHFL